MIKLTVEIKDEKFIFNYEVGESRHSGTSNICPDNLCLFTNLLNACSSVYKYADREWEREMIAKAWLEKQANK